MSSFSETLGAQALHEVRDLHAAREGAPVAVRFDDVCKTYRLYHNDRARLVDGLTGFAYDRYVKRLKRANDHLSFTIRAGESVAFLGRNGAGKSTACKLIAGVAWPDSGTVEVNGNVTAMIGQRMGMNPELSGRDNLVMRGLTMGMERPEIDAIMDDIVEFAELGDYIDQPMRTYSSGMRARLGFSFAAAASPDILVADETLAVGDAAFNAKCLARIHEIMLDEHVTVCLVTHSLETARDACSRGIVLDSGRLAFDGAIEDAIGYYEAHCTD